jgi:hypothetical protein
MSCEDIQHKQRQMGKVPSVSSILEPLIDCSGSRRTARLLQVQDKSAKDSTVNIGRSVAASKDTREQRTGKIEDACEGEEGGSCSDENDEVAHETCCGKELPTDRHQNRSSKVYGASGNVFADTEEGEYTSRSSVRRQQGANCYGNETDFKLQSRITS